MVGWFSHRFTGDWFLVSQEKCEEIVLFLNTCSCLLAMFGSLVAGLAFAESDYWCFATPVPPGLTQCGCPTSVAADFCASSRPMPGMSLITYYYCVGWAGQNCTPNNRSCGSHVWLCVGCRCDWGSQSQPGCNGSNCTPTAKVGFCTQNYGCS